MENHDNLKPFSRLNPLDNFLFFKIFGEKGCEAQLIGFLNAVLGHAGVFSGMEPIKSVIIQENKEFPKETLGGKSCNLDILAFLKDGVRVNIEVQIRDEHNMDRRSLYYWSKVYTKNFKKGQDYKELPNVIAINLVDFNFPKKGGFHTCFHLREDTDPSIILTEAMEIHFINMVKWRKIKNKDIKSDSLHRWLTWLNDSSPPELIEEVIKMDMSIFTANERQELLDATDEEISTRIFYKEMIMYDEGSRLKGIQLKAERRGEKRGEKKGQETAKINIARNLLAEGSSPEFVRKITGLDMETIESL